MTRLPHCDTLRLDLHGSTLFITLNRPEVRNAMSLRMVAELSTVFTLIETDPAVRAVVLRGAGGHFCSGGDLHDMAEARGRPQEGGQPDPFHTLNRAFGRLLQQVNAAANIVVTVLEGTVMGGGLGLACVSDVALAGVQTRFALPETSLGVIPAQIAPFVVQRIGLTQARRLALLGITVDAHEARALGLVHQVAEGDAELDTQLQQVLARVRRCAPDATARTKALLHRVGQEPMADLLDDAAALFAQAMRGPEGAEGTLAFIQKRPPGWAENDH